MQRFQKKSKGPMLSVDCLSWRSCLVVAFLTCFTFCSTLLLLSSGALTSRHAGCIGTQLANFDFITLLDAARAMHDKKGEKVFLANFGCGFSGQDPINEYVNRRLKSGDKELVGLWVDPKSCDVPHSAITYIQRALNPDTSAVEVLRALPAHAHFLALKIDIDSLDCDTMKRILDAGAAPSIISIETMGCFPPPIRFSLHSTPHAMSHEPDSAREFGELPHPKNCCLYSCSMQSAIDIAEARGYVTVRAFKGDIWFVRSTLALDIQLPPRVRAMFDPRLSYAYRDLACAYLDADAGFVGGDLGGFNLHQDYVVDWINGFSASPNATFQAVCRTFFERCSHRRLQDSVYTLSLDTGHSIICGM